MVSPCRRREVTRARHIAMYLSRKLAASPGGTPMTPSTGRSAPSFPRIGMAFARDHSSVIHACTGIGRRLRDDAGLALLLDRLASELGDWPATPAVAREGL
jgi:chromosomal replication initiation ATPase DnaA